MLHHTATTAAATETLATLAPRMSGSGSVLLLAERVGDVTVRLVLDVFRGRPICFTVIRGTAAPFRCEHTRAWEPSDDVVRAFRLALRFAHEDLAAAEAALADAMDAEQRAALYC